MCLTWSCTSSRTNVSVGECRSPSALPTVLRSSALGALQRGRGARLGRRVAEHRVEDGRLAQVSGDPGVGDGDHPEPGVLDLASAPPTRPAPAPAPRAGVPWPDPSSRHLHGVRSADPATGGRDRRPVSTLPRGTHRRPARRHPVSRHRHAVQPAAHRQQLDLRPAGHQALAGVEHLADVRRSRRPPRPPRSRPDRAGRARPPRRPTPRTGAAPPRSAVRMIAWP